MDEGSRRPVEPSWRRQKNVSFDAPSDGTGAASCGSPHAIQSYAHGSTRHCQQPYNQSTPNPTNLAEDDALQVGAMSEPFTIDDVQDCTMVTKCRANWGSHELTNLGCPIQELGTQRAYDRAPISNYRPTQKFRIRWSGGHQNLERNEFKIAGKRGTTRLCRASARATIMDNQVLDTHGTRSNHKVNSGA